jgi:hypothetical protein
MWGGGQGPGTGEQLGITQVARFARHNASTEQGRQGIGENGGTDAWGW